MLGDTLWFWKNTRFGGGRQVVGQAVSCGEAFRMCTMCAAQLCTQPCDELMEVHVSGEEHCLLTVSDSSESDPGWLQSFYELCPPARSHWGSKTLS